MKKVYEEVKKWILENGVEVKCGDVVKIKFNLNEKQVGKAFLDEHPDNEVILRITKLNKSFMEGTIDGNHTHYLILYPRDIVDVEPYIDKEQDKIIEEPELE